MDEKDTDAETGRQRERGSEAERQRGRETERERQRETERQRRRQFISLAHAGDPKDATPVLLRC